jgi:Spy/CpxP family protein refolding chaperone
MGAILTQEQRTKMREAMQDSRTEVTALTEKLAAAEKEAMKAALAENPDEKTVRAKIEAVTKIQTDLMMLRLKGVKAIASTLTAEQKSQLENAPRGGFMALFGGMMGGPGRGPRGGGGGGGGGNNN